MTRQLGLLIAISLLSLPAAAQQPREAAYVYEAFYRIRYADLDAWNESYWNDSVPVLQQLQQEGIIEGWSQYQHHTGGDYNIRFAVRTYDWASIETFWNEYLDRMDAAMSPEADERRTRMIIEHRDEIWSIGQVNVADDLEVTHLYSSLFSVNFADMQEWQALWNDAAGPLLAQAMADGVLGGWVRLDHDTGGPYNSKLLFLFDDWDNIDDVIFDRMIGTLVEEQPEQWARLNALFDRHDDVIWEPAQAPE
jgi:hypothetical protein